MFSIGVLYLIIYMCYFVYARILYTANMLTVLNCILHTILYNMLYRRLLPGSYCLRAERADFPVVFGPHRHILLICHLVVGR